MIIGILAITIGFIAALISTVSYGFYYKEKDERLLRLGNLFFAITGGAILFSVILLSYSLMTHNFQLNYVYNYSSRSLNKFYLFSTFWAGQEGTFLLWLLYGTIFGLVLIKTVARKQPLVMVFLMAIHSFILLILLNKSPFAAIWHVHEEAPVGFMPADGAGLNPLLQNPWMVIHPPTLFLGYSSTMIPFVFAMTALVTREFQSWIKMVKPWVIFSTLILITGISMGGYWAYVTLGWGGYWAWDPVENASLVPWLFSVALLHGIVVQQRRKSLVRTNLFLAGGGFVAMLWGSFLTRSGVLTDFSVHSFAASGLTMYLLIFVGLFTGAFLFAYFRNTKYIKSEKFSDKFLTRETFMLMGMSTFIVLGLIVLVGTSAPIYTSFFGEASSVSAGFYNITSIPVTALMLIAVAVAPLLVWKVADYRKKDTLLYSGLSAVVITLIAILMGLREPISVFLFLLAAFVIVINAIVSYGLLRKNYAKAGGYIAHVGLGFMVIGILTSSLYDNSQKIMLPDGEFQKTKFGYELKFAGFKSMPDGKDEANVIVKTDYGTYEANPRFYYSDYAKSYMANPDVNERFLKDIYISPISFTPAKLSNIQEVQLGKKESVELDNLKVTFNEFKVAMTEGAQIINANLLVSVNENSYWTDYEVMPTLTAQSGQFSRTKAEVGDTGYEVQIQSVNASSGTVVLGIISPSAGGAAGKDMFAVEVTEKPLISILWIGILIVIAGMLLSMFTRKKAMDSAV